MQKWPLVASMVLLSTLAGTAEALEITVGTTADTFAFDNACSLREAIVASNEDRQGDLTAPECLGGGIDSIRFGRGITTITVGSALPTITQQVTITGPSGRVVLNGPGSGTGLNIASTAPGTFVSRLAIQDFGTAILVAGANSVVAGNFIGTDAAGNAVVTNILGVDVTASGVRIGGTVGNTPGGACTGECNLISGNVQFGIFVSGSSATIQGNYIGTNAAGTAALVVNPGTGMRIAGGATATIGGTTAADANLVSGNNAGIEFTITQNAAGSSVLGNRIGTNSAGTAAVPNVHGIAVYLTGHNYPVVIGGSAAGSGNVISGNGTSGIYLGGAANVQLKGNRIGTAANGVSPLGNVGAGILLDAAALNGASNSNVIGGAAMGDANVIAWNGIGVLIGTGNQSNAIIGNSIRDNAGMGIQLNDMQSGTIATPSITTLNPVVGAGCGGCRIDVYSDYVDEGRAYHGSVLANGAGNWSFPGAVDGPYVTATATSLGGSTSQFSAPFFEDSDGDGLADNDDNCLLVANANQRDADADGFGNACDADLDNTGLVTSLDFNLFRTVINRLANSGPLAAAADMDGSGLVTVQDYVVLRLRLNSAPGPSGLACAGTIPCGTT